MNEQGGDNKGNQRAYHQEPSVLENAPTANQQQQRQSDQIQHLEHRVISAERWMLRWTGVVALFTFVSAIATCIYVYSFIESERAYLVTPAVTMMNGTEPSTAPDGMSLHLLVKNVGKHPANITDISTIPTVHIINKELPPMPDYKEHRNILTIEGTGPIVPSDTIDLMMHSVQQNFRFANR